MGKKDQFLENSPSLPIASVGNVSNFERFVAKGTLKAKCGIQSAQLTVGHNMGKKDQFLENFPSLPIASIGNVSNFEKFVAKATQEEDRLSSHYEGASAITRL
ncbi:hypothetical protein Ancab_015303 [Ancistrocladus abbreviatus]